MFHLFGMIIEKGVIMRTQIDIDVSLEQIVYIDHKQYKIKKILIESYINSYQSVRNEFLFHLENQETFTVYERKREDFKTTFEYKSYLIDLVNSLDDIGN